MDHFATAAKFPFPLTDAWHGDAERYELCKEWEQGSDNGGK
jgi:hypothetical protein